ncbi:MAG: SDR family NAD(P)-dependent oxidoreductase, partial [Alphaproteobacteria bacterium]|nr:SDR family NAD(P)-dependent oxidoreductase [Alphaproteobacteria bacterium]
FGHGYTGVAIALRAQALGIPAMVASRRAAPGSALPCVPFADAARAIASASHILVTAPPEPAGDPALRAYHAEIAGASELRWIGYLSSTAVYGDRAGGWVDETTAPAPASGRGVLRLKVEDAWGEFADTRAVDLFRLAGIYGPGRSAFDALRAGTARRIDKPGHAFSRIHRDDIAGAVCAALLQERSKGRRILHLADDLPAESAAVTTEAARLLGIPPPPLLPWPAAAVGMSAMARSFWSENRRTRSQATQAALEYRWRYPDYRTGLEAILAEEGADGAAQQGDVAVA